VASSLHERLKFRDGNNQGQRPVCNVIGRSLGWLLGHLQRAVKDFDVLGLARKAVVNFEP
jgi:hypothetical protein